MPEERAPRLGLMPFHVGCGQCNHLWRENCALLRRVAELELALKEAEECLRSRSGEATTPSGEPPTVHPS